VTYSLVVGSPSGGEEILLWKTPLKSEGFFII